VKARNRPPRLDERPAARSVAPPPTPEDLLVRARIAGKVTTPGPRELRHDVARLEGNPVELWAAIEAVFGARVDQPEVDPARTVRTARIAADRIGTIARAGGRVALATAQPASLLGVHTALARRVVAAGGTVDDCEDAGPMRVDGRAPRWLRWLEGVAVVTDGSSLLATTGADAAEEWMFLAGRPDLVVTDGAFAGSALRAGVDVIAFAGLDRLDLAMPAARAEECLVVPLHGGRPARAYRPLVTLLESAFAAGPSAAGPEL
jgi:hypothetical protein